MQNSKELTVKAGQKECDCPQCKQLVLVTPGHFKQVMGCPRCNHQFRLFLPRVNGGRVLTVAVGAGLGALAITPQVPLAVTGTAAAVYGLALLVRALKQCQPGGPIAHGLHHLRANWGKVALAAALAVAGGLAWQDHRAGQAALLAQQVAQTAALREANELAKDVARQRQSEIRLAERMEDSRQSSANLRERLAAIKEDSQRSEASLDARMAALDRLRQERLDQERNRLMAEANAQAQRLRLYGR